MRIIYFVTLILLGGCVDLSTICPHKTITQGVFGEIVDSNNTLEQNITVDAYSTLNGAQDMKLGSVSTTRGGYQFNLLAGGPYMLCAKTVCTSVSVPTGLVEISAVDAASGLTWDAPVSVPPEQMIGPCTWGSN